jgi:recombinational DNA repair protein (RecF pathway)
MKHIKLFEELTKKPGHCDRCGNPTTSTSMSWLNTEMICPDCQETEEGEPDYMIAKAKEAEEVKKGNYNYGGWRGERP